MPFDGLSGDRVSVRQTDSAATRSALAQAAANLGLRGISPQTLEQHKHAEVAKYPKDGNFAYRHRYRLFLINRLMMSIGFFTLYLSIVMVVIDSVLWPMYFVLSLDHALILLAGSFIPVVGTLIAFHKIILRGPATWIERTLTGMEPTDGDAKSAGVPKPTDVFLASMPSSVRRIADALRQDLQAHGHWNGQFRFVCGELWQDDRILDPYLTLHDTETDEYLIIGIWIDATVLHLAHQETPRHGLR